MDVAITRDVDITRAFDITRLLLFVLFLELGSRILLALESVRSWHMPSIYLLFANDPINVKTSTTALSRAAS